MKKRCTIKTIADILGVAPSTVSRAFQPDSRISSAQRALVLKTAKEMNYVPNQAASRLNQKEVYIAFLIQSNYPAGRDQFVLAIKEAHQNFKDYKVSYSIDYFEDAEDTPEYCAALFEKYAEYDGLVVSGISSKNILLEIEKFKESGKAVALLQSGAISDCYLFRIVPSTIIGAQMAAEYLSLCMTPLTQKRVILLTGNKELDVHYQGEAAFLNACRDAGMEVTGIYDMKDKEEVLQELIDTVLTPERLMETEGIYISSGLCLPLCKYIEDCGMSDKIFLVTTDSSPELQYYFKNGTVNASIYQNYFQQALDAYEYMVRHLISHEEIKKTIAPHPELIMKSNCSFYLWP